MHRIKLIALVFFMLGTIAVTATAQNATSSSMQEKKTLYDRLGGYNAIAAVVDDFIGRLIADERLTKFFKGAGEDTQKRIRQHVVDQLCAAAGGPCYYTGRDMKTTHKGLGITEDDWNASAKHLVESLDKFKVPEKEKNELLAVVTSLKKDIVEK